MKPILAALALFLAAVAAQAAGIPPPVVSEVLTVGPWTLHKGTVKQPNEYPTLAECQQVVHGLAAALTTTTATFYCRNEAKVVVTLTPGPKPDSEVRDVACPAGSTPGATWQQLRYYTELKTPPFWKATTWAPTTKPTSACPPAPPTVAWTKFAKEDESFVLKKAADVRYGSEPKWATKSIAAGVLTKCSNGVFGDPVPNVVKQCETTTAGNGQVWPAQPQGEFQMLSCPTGSAPGAQWRQDRDYVMAPAPVFWKAGPWLPTTIPAAACTPAPPPPQQAMHSGWPIDDSTVDFTPNPGKKEILIASLVDYPTVPGDGTGAFRTVCYFNKFAYVDPVVYFGKPNSSHLHAFFCNDGMTENSTADSMALSGSTSRGGAMNLSGVWVPPFVDTLGNVVKKPRVVIVYYKKASWTDAKSIQPIPVGLKAVFGDPGAMGYTRWGVTGFSCNGEAVAKDNEEPFIAGQHVIPTTEQCGPGNEIWSGVVAMHCWDGKNLDSPDHRSHMAYSASPWNEDTLPNGCQKSHPVLLPQIAILAITPVGPNDKPTRWVLASDHKMTGTPGPGDLVFPDGTFVKRGASMHADYFAHWLPEFQNVWIEKCLRASMDCSAHKLGDGRTLEMFGGN